MTDRQRLRDSLLYLLAHFSLAEILAEFARILSSLDRDRAVIVLASLASAMAEIDPCGGC